jgi:hypothetical protein
VKLPRLLAVSFLTLGTSFFFTPSANAESTGPATITCAKDDGTQRTANVSWDNANQYFNGKGDIARLFCEGGHSGGFPIFVSTTVPDGPLRYYNGVAPTPTPSPTPSPSSSPTPEPSPTQPEPSPSPSNGATVPSSPAPTPEPSPTPSVTPEVSPSPEPTVAPTPSPEPTNTAPLPEPSPTPPPVPVTPPEPTPIPQPEPIPVPQPSPEPVTPPEPEPVPVEPAPEPAPEPVEPAPEPVPTPEPEEVPAPVIPEPAPEPAPEPPVEEPEPPAVATEDSTPEEREAVAEALIEAADGEPLTADAIEEAGLTYEDLPPETPVEVRQDENGNEVVITAEVAAALVVLESPAALVEAIFTDPAQALLAFASIGADMSEEEREESEKIIVASVIAGQAAINAAGMAGAAAAYRRNP